MTQNYILQKSSRASKKLIFITLFGKRINFRQKGYEDMITHKNEARKHELYKHTFFK